MMNLNEKRQEIIAVATELFEKFVNMPKDVRPDDKERTGIQVLVWEPGTRNLVMVSIKEPSEAARFFSVEKAVRANTLEYVSSEDCGDPTAMQFGGSLSVLLHQIPGFKSEKEGELIASTSGLTAEEDTVISASVLAKVVGVSFSQICEYVDSCGASLPDWYYYDDNDDDINYFKFLFE